jgi:hypothetical protein
MTLRQREATVRFGLRAILVGTAAVALFFGAAAPALRVWSAAESQAFLAVWGEAFVVVAGFAAIGCLLRLRAERRAGDVHFELPIVHARLLYFTVALLSIVVLGVVVDLSLLQRHNAALFMEISKQGGTITFPSPLWSIPFVIGPGMALAMFGMMLWWRAFRVEFCEFGILSFISFVPWWSVDFELLDGQPSVLVVRRTVGQYTARLRWGRAAVPSKMLPQVREMLQKRGAGSSSDSFVERFV